jgi:hypothetical protein
MKFKIFLSLLLLFIATSCAIGGNTDMVTTESIFYVKATHTFPENFLQNLKPMESKSQLMSFFKTCEPFNENIKVNILGFDAVLNFKSNGMINKKCSYDISGKINSIPESFFAGTDSSYRQGFIGVEPKVKCELTKEQVAMVVDDFEKSYNQYMYDKMSKSPKAARKNFEKKMLNDKLYTELANEHVCKLVNPEEVMGIFTQISQPSEQEESENL